MFPTAFSAAGELATHLQMEAFADFMRQYQRPVSVTYSTVHVGFYLFRLGEGK